MKLIIAGYGKMGKMLKAKALERGHEVIAAVDPMTKAETEPGFTVYNSLADAEAGSPGKRLEDADAVIEFTSPKTAPGNIRFLAERKIPVVVGTTGWYDSLAELTGLVNASGSAMLWASNFSLGVNLFYRLAEYAAGLIDPFADYDAGGYECHHNKKADSPSGTAKILVERVLAKMKRKTKAVYETLESRPPDPGELHYASMRTGSIPGIHTLIFDSAFDTIEITHTARSREGFAAGAVVAAEWLNSTLKEKTKSGVFTMDDVLEDVL